MEINTNNDFALAFRNGSAGKALYPLFKPAHRTKQSAYRYAAWLIGMAEVLPDEPGEHTFEQILEAVRNT